MDISYKILEGPIKENNNVICHLSKQVVPEILHASRSQPAQPIKPPP